MEKILEFKNICDFCVIDEWVFFLKVFIMSGVFIEKDLFEIVLSNVVIVILNVLILIYDD